MYRRRRRSRRLPLYMFLLALISFTLAFACPQDKPEDLTRPMPVRTLSASEPEPDIPHGTPFRRTTQSPAHS